MSNTANKASAAAAASSSSSSSAPSSPPGWPDGISVQHIQSTHDGTWQPTLYYAPSLPSSISSRSSPQKQERKRKRRPLLIGLHTWSFDYTQCTPAQVQYATWCMSHDWYFLHPHFRGPNNHPEACGSTAALQDVLDAVDWVMAKNSNDDSSDDNDDNDTVTFTVDPDRIYVVGVSGGAHLALLLASLYPERWAGVSAWNGIVDLEAWWKERHYNQQLLEYERYARDIERVVGGVPEQQQKQKQKQKQKQDDQTEEDSPLSIVLEECRQRSPFTHLARLSTAIVTTVSGCCPVSLDINAGIHDGRKGSVPFTHSLRAFDAIVGDGSNNNNSNKDTIELYLGDEAIQNFYATQQPPTLKTTTTTTPTLSTMDSLYGDRAIHYRRIFTEISPKINKSARITIFEGGHEIINRAALNWLAQQRRGAPSVWDIIVDDDDDKNGGGGGDDDGNSRNSRNSRKSIDWLPVDPNVTQSGK